MSASKTPSTKKSAPTTTNFSKGINTYLPNDILEYEQVRIAQNVRFDRIGEYKTRTGIRALTEPDGLTTIIDHPISGGGVMPNYQLVDCKDLKITYSIPSGVDEGLKIYSIKLHLQPKGYHPYPYHVIKVEVWRDNSSLLIPRPDELIATACAKYNGNFTDGYTFYFPNGFDVRDRWYLKVGTQDVSTVEYQIAYPNSPFQTQEPKGEVNAAPPSKVIGIFEANLAPLDENNDARVQEKFLLYATNANNTLKVKVINPDDTVATLFQTGLGSDSDKRRVRFSQNANEIRFAYGGSPQKAIVRWYQMVSPSGSHYYWTVNNIVTEDLQTGVDLQIKVNNILTGTNDNIMYFDSETDTQAVWTNPHNLEFAKPINYITTASINSFVVGETTTTTISTSTMEAVADDHLVSDIEIGDIVVDENDNYGEVTDITGQNITLESISHAATAIDSYDKFDRDFRQNFPSIKTGDPLTAMFNLGGIIFVTTRRHKYYLWSQTADVFGYKTSAAQHGTFSQESVVCDYNYAYYACDDGIYMFNGSNEVSLTDTTIQNIYDRIPNKETITLGLYNNRLYVFFGAQNATRNDSCLVYNINLHVWESLDTKLPVLMATAQTASNRFICGSNTFAQLMEYDSYYTAPNTLYNYTQSDYADFGSVPIDMDIATSYLHFGTPSQLHRITKWRPEFGLEAYPYKVRCGYALDFTDQVRYSFSIDLHDGTMWNEHIADDWDNNNIVTIGERGIPTKLTTIPKVYNQFRRCQIRYQHHAAFEPVSFKSHTLCVQTQRIR